MVLVAAGAWAQGPPESDVYVDRVLEEGTQTIQADTGDVDTSGWPRSWSAEVQATKQRNAGVTSNNQSVLFSGSVDTPNYGTISANGSLARQSTPVVGYGVLGSIGTPSVLVPYYYSSGSTWRIDQRGMPFDNGWLGNSSIGDINISGTPLARAAGRVYLPSLSIEGAAVTLEQSGGTSFNASAGRLGNFGGLGSQGSSGYQGPFANQSLSATQGTAAGVGAQTQLSGGGGPFALGRIDAAAQAVEARGVNLNGVPGFAQDTQSVWAAASWQGLAPWADALGSGFGGVADKVGGMRIQANVVKSSGRPSEATSLAPYDSASGAWLDANWRTELMQQSATLYRFDPSLRWGSESLPNNLQGATWRSDMSSRQWQLGSDVELSDSVSGISARSLYGSLFGRYRFDSRDALSGNVATRTGIYAAQSAQLTWEDKSDWGYTQSRIDVAQGADLHVVRTGVDQSWNVGEAQTLSTTLALQQSQAAGISARSVQWAILGTTPLPSGARLDLSVRGSDGLGNNPGNFLSANARLSWPLGGGWSFIAQYTAARGQEPLNPAVLSALTTATLQPVAGDNYLERSATTIVSG